MALGLSAALQFSILQSLDRDLQAKTKALNMAPTPKLQGIASSLHKLTFALEDRAAKLAERIGNADNKADTAFKSANERLDGVEGHLGDIERFISDLDGANGPPAA